MGSRGAEVGTEQQRLSCGGRARGGVLGSGGTALFLRVQAEPGRPRPLAAPPPEGQRFLGPPEDWRGRVGRLCGRGGNSELAL